jgi:metal-sulfur cluster biosynthetic enzyme
MGLPRAGAGGVAGSDRAQRLTPQKLRMVSEENILRALRAVKDPEGGVNIVDLGLIYSTEIHGATVRIVMTMTTPACPMHSYITEEVREAILTQDEEVQKVDVHLVWDSPWSPRMISQEGKRQLGWQ